MRDRKMDRDQLEDFLVRNLTEERDDRFLMIGTPGRDWFRLEIAGTATRKHSYRKIHLPQDVGGELFDGWTTKDGLGDPSSWLGARTLLGLLGFSPKEIAQKVQEEHDRVLERALEGRKKNRAYLLDQLQGIADQMSRGGSIIRTFSEEEVEMVREVARALRKNP